MDISLPFQFATQLGVIKLAFVAVRMDRVEGSLTVDIASSGLKLEMPFSVSGYGLHRFNEELQLLCSTKAGMARLYSPPVPLTYFVIWVVRREKWYDALPDSTPRLDFCASLGLNAPGGPSVQTADGGLTGDAEHVWFTHQIRGLRLTFEQLPDLIAFVQECISHYNPPVVAPTEPDFDDRVRRTLE